MSSGRTALRQTSEDFQTYVQSLGALAVTALAGPDVTVVSANAALQSVTTNSLILDHLIGKMSVNNFSRSAAVGTACVILDGVKGENCTPLATTVAYCTQMRWATSRTPSADIAMADDPTRSVLRPQTTLTAEATGRLRFVVNPDAYPGPMEAGSFERIRILSESKRDRRKLTTLSKDASDVLKQARRRVYNAWEVEDAELYKLELHVKKLARCCVIFTVPQRRCLPQELIKEIDEIYYRLQWQKIHDEVVEFFAMISENKFGTANVAPPVPAQIKSEDELTEAQMAYIKFMRHRGLDVDANDTVAGGQAGADLVTFTRNITAPYQQLYKYLFDDKNANSLYQRPGTVGSLTVAQVRSTTSRLLNDYRVLCEPERAVKASAEALLQQLNITDYKLKPNLTAPLVQAAQMCATADAGSAVMLLTASMGGNIETAAIGDHYGGGDRGGGANRTRDTDEDKEADENNGYKSSNNLTLKDIVKGMHVPERLKGADRVKAQEIIDDARDGNYPYLPSKQSEGLAADDPFANVDYAEWFKWKGFGARKHYCIQYARSKARGKKRKQDETAAVESSEGDSEDEQVYTRERPPARRRQKSRSQRAREANDKSKDKKFTELSDKVSSLMELAKSLAKNRGPEIVNALELPEGVDPDLAALMQQMHGSASDGEADAAAAVDGVQLTKKKKKPKYMITQLAAIADLAGEHEPVQQSIHDLAKTPALSVNGLAGLFLVMGLLAAFFMLAACTSAPALLATGACVVTYNFATPPKSVVTLGCAIAALFALVLLLLHGPTSSPAGARISFIATAPTVISANSTCSIGARAVCTNAEIDQAFTYHALGTVGTGWAAADSVILGEELYNGATELTVTNYTDEAITLDCTNELAAVSSEPIVPDATSASIFSLEHIANIVHGWTRTDFVASVLFNRVSDIDAMSRLDGPSDENRTFFYVHDAMGNKIGQCLADSGSTSALFVRSEFMTVLNKSDRVAWINPFGSDKQRLHKLVTYNKGAGPSIIGQCGIYITVNVKAPGATTDKFEEVLVTAYIISGTSPGADLLAGCRWLGSKGLIPLATARDGKLKTEVLTEYNTLPNDSLPQVVLDAICKPASAPQGFMLYPAHRANVTSAVQNQMSTRVQLGQPVAPLGQRTHLNRTTGAAAMDLETNTDGAAAEEVELGVQRDQDLIDAVQQLVNQYHGNVEDIVGALASESGTSRNEAGEHVNWACSHGVKLYQSDDL